MVQLGSLVLSKAGRDKDRYFIIIGIVDSNHVNIADGDLRKIENPKMKKLIHLKLVEECVPNLAEHLNKNSKLTNAMLRKLLKDIDYPERVFDNNKEVE